MAFLLIAFGGFFFLVLSSLFGGHDHGDVGGGDHDFSHDIGGHEAADYQASGPSPVSLRTISIFVTVFGLAGWLAQYYGASTGLATGVGLAGGLVIAAIAFQFVKVLYAQQGSSTISVTELVGQSAVVTTAIPSDGVGEVAVIYGGQRKDLLARSREGAILAGTKVEIVDNLGESVLVSAQAGRNA